jgi:hypothetical protein
MRLLSYYQANDRRVLGAVYYDRREERTVLPLGRSARVCLRYHDRGFLTGQTERSCIHSHKHPAAIRSGAFAALANLAYADQIQAQPLRQGAAIKGYIDLLMTCDEDTADTILSSILRLARMDQNRQTAGTLSPGREKKAPMVPLANYPDSLRIYKVCSVMLSVMLR